MQEDSQIDDDEIPGQAMIGWTGWSYVRMRVEDDGILITSHFLIPSQCYIPRSEITRIVRCGILRGWGIRIHHNKSAQLPRVFFGTWRPRLLEQKLREKGYSINKYRLLF